MPLSIPEPVIEPSFKLEALHVPQVHEEADQVWLNVFAEPIANADGVPLRIEGEGLELLSRNPAVSAGGARTEGRVLESCKPRRRLPRTLGAGANRPVRRRYGTQRVPRLHGAGGVDGRPTRPRLGLTILNPSPGASCNTTPRRAHGPDSRSKSLRNTILIILVSLLVACSGGPTGDKLTAIRFMNLMTDTSLVVFQVERSSFPSTDFRQVTPYQPFGGTYDFDLELGQCGQYVHESDRRSRADGRRRQRLDVFAVGTIAAPEFIPAFRANGEIAVDTTRVQFINGTQESLVVTLYANGQPVAGLLSSATVGARNFAAAELVTSQSGRVRVERTDGTLLYDGDAFTLASQGDLTIVLTEYVGPGRNRSRCCSWTRARSSVPRRVGRPASVRYAHALTNLPDATVTRTDSMQMSTDTSVSFSTASARETVAADTFDISVAPAGSPGAPVYNTTAELAADREYTIVLTGDLGAPSSFELFDNTRVVSNCCQGAGRQRRCAAARGRLLL